MPRLPRGRYTIRRVFVMGHSAGGYNAAMLALDARWLSGTGHAPAEPDGSLGPVILRHRDGADGAHMNEQCIRQARLLPAAS